MTLKNAIYALFLTVAIIATATLLTLFGLRNVSTVQASGVGSDIIVKAPTTAASADLTTTSSRIVATSTSRRYLRVCNDGNAVAYLNFGNIAVLDAGMRLGTTSCMSFGTTEPLFYAALHAVASTSPTHLTVLEVNAGQTFGN